MIKAAEYCFIICMSPSRGLGLCIRFCIKGTLLAEAFTLKELASFVSHKPGSNF